MILHAKICFPEAITTMIWPYATKAFVEQLNVIKVDDDGINHLEKFSGTTTDISLKNSHTWGCPVYVLDAGLQVNISGLPKWEPFSQAEIYLGHSPFHALSVALVIKPATGHISTQFHVVFDDKFSTGPFI